MPQITHSVPNRNSLLLWWPKVEALALPRPETLIIKVPASESLWDVLDHKSSFSSTLIEAVKMACRVVGYAAFLRTDLLSGKHSYRETCYVSDESQVESHMWRLMEEHVLALDDLPHAFVVREFLHLDSKFAAFEGLPIAPERRYFVRGSEVLCHHPYWPADAIRRPNLREWRACLSEMNRESPFEITSLTSLAQMIGQALGDESWSVDFARTIEGEWYFIDTARAEESWHPEHTEQGAS